LLAIVVGVQHYHEFLAPKPFLIRTDNSAVKYLNSVKHVTGRLERWNLVLSFHTYRVEHIKEKKNIVADRLSRIELPAGEEEVEEMLDNMVSNITTLPDKDDDCEVLEHRSNEVWKISFNKAAPDDADDDNMVADTNDDDDSLASYNLTDLQATCPDCKQIINYLCHGILPRDNAAARKIIFQAKKYTMIDNILYHLDLPRQRKRLASEHVTQQLVIPRSLRELLMQSYHDKRSHTGPEKTYNTIRQKFYWHGLYFDVFEWCKTCNECQTGKGSVVFQAPLKPLSTPSTIFKKWHVDHLKLCKAKEYNYILGCVDFLSLWSVLLPARSTSAEETTQLLHDNIFMVYGCLTLISDRGAAFRSKLVRSLCKMLGMSQIFTSSRHRQSNSKCEAYNKNILNSLKTRCESVYNWPSFLPVIKHAFRTSVLKHIGVSPFEILFGQKPRLPIEETLLPPTILSTNAKSYYEKI